MKELKSVGVVAVAIIGVALVAGLLYGMTRLTDKTIVVLAAVVVGGVVLALIIFVSAYPIKAVKGPTPPERHVIRETRVIDGRTPSFPRVIQAQPTMGPVLPELLRAAYSAGARLPSGERGQDSPIGWEWGDTWDGEIIDSEGV